ncbi:MAG: hypothetical protein VW270_21940 [Candidatus Poseidoniales archaeon]
MNYKIVGVEALYPRINKTYKFDNGENRSVPCDPLDDGATYEMSFKMDEKQAKALMTAMASAYKEKREAKWPEKFPVPFSKDDDGMYIGKAKLKGAYGKDATAKPKQYDAKNKVLPDDFQLTTGSTVNIAVVLVPYNMRDAGVSLRLRAVQVIKYVPLQVASPFDEVDGFDSNEGESDESPFFDLEADSGVELEEVVEEPKKKAAKVKSAAPKEKEDLSDLVDAWDD